MSARKKWSPPAYAVTVDIVVFGLDRLQRKLDVLLIRRGHPPYEGAWALPGGYVEKRESLENAAFRELKEETGISPDYLEQLFTFGDPKRDPRGRTVSVGYMALVDKDGYEPTAGSDAAHAGWYDARKLSDRPSRKAAFDHREILRMAIKRLENKIRYSPIVFSLLEEEFTLGEMQKVCEIILGNKLDKANFRRKVLSNDFIQVVHSGAVLPASYVAYYGSRPVGLYRFDRNAYSMHQHVEIF